MTAGVEGRFSGRLGAFEFDTEFSLAPTGITALSGPSGSGKTSLLRCIAGLTRLPGRLIVDGDVWQDARTFLATHRRPVGVVFQEPSLLHHLSVRGNLDYGARRSPAKGTSLDEVVDLLGLAPLLARSTTHLSGGERQRVALGRALLSQPRLLLMDEPLSSLDAASKAEVLPYLEQLHRSLSLPVIYVSHDALEVARLADRVMRMAGGKLVAVHEAASADPLRNLSEAQVRTLARAALAAGLEAGA
jgi:molybdate transport system ATP-binding protein